MYKNIVCDFTVACAGIGVFSVDEIAETRGYKIKMINLENIPNVSSHLIVSEHNDLSKT